MAERTVNLKLKVVPANETKKSLDNLQKISTNWDKVFGPNGDKPVKNTKRQVDLLTRSWQDLGNAIKLAKDNFKAGFASGSQSLQGLKRFTDGIDTAAKKVFNLRNAIAGTVIGGAAIWGVKKIFEEGAEDIKTRKRLRREFGDKGAADIESASERVAFKAGLQGDEVSRGLIPLSQQLEAIQEGAIFRGMKRKLTAKEAEDLKKKNLNFGASIFGRVATMAPDIAPEDLGRILGDALAGPEGIRSMVSSLNLSKRSRTLSTANEKGEAYKVLSPEERKRLGITKKGQYLEQGDLVNLLLERSGITEAAAKDEQKTFSHQLRQIKATLFDQVGDIGSGALDSLTAKLGEGATAAERLQKFLASDEGKRTVDSVKNGVVSIVEGIAGIVQSLPAIGSWLKEHKMLLATLAGAYGVAKVAPTAIGLAKGVSTAITGVRGATPATPLYVQNVMGAVGSSPGGMLAKAGAVAAAGALGYAAGTYLDSKLGISDKIAGTGAKFDAAGEERNRQAIARSAAEKQALVRELESAGLSHGKAVYYANHEKERELALTTQVNVDGVALWKVLERHAVRGAQNRTANGAAPVSK